MLWGITEKTIEEWLGVDPAAAQRCPARGARVRRQGDGAGPRDYPLGGPLPRRRGRDPDLPHHGAELGARLLPHRRGGLRRRRHDGAHRDHLARVRAPCGRGRGLRDRDDQAPATGSRSTATRARSRCWREPRHDRRFPSSSGWIDDVGAGESAARRQVREPRRDDGGRVLAVPPGFGVTTARPIASFMEHTRASMARQRARAGRPRAARLSRRSTSDRGRGSWRPSAPSPMPAALEAAIRQQLQRCWKREDGPGRRAGRRVRSSGEAEDLADASFAGQYDTYLWIVGAQTRCSGTSGRAGPACSAIRPSPTGPAKRRRPPA